MFSEILQQKIPEYFLDDFSVKVPTVIRCSSVAVGVVLDVGLRADG